MGCATFQRARSLSLQFRTVSRRGVTEPATISTNNPGHPEPAWAGLKVEKQVKRARLTEILSGQRYHHDNRRDVCLHF